ncbi:unnamed protein product [Brassica oleracea var. botrytis]
MLPYVSNVQTEPVVVQIDKLDLVLEENPDDDVTKGPSSAQSPTASGKSNGYGFADRVSYIFHYVDQIADGMTLQVKVVNLLLETGGGAHREGGCKSERSKGLTSLLTPDLFICLRNLNGKFYQIDLPPHPDMFIDANLARSEEENLRDDDGANQVFFGGERFLDGISGQAHSAEAAGRSLVSVLVDHVFLCIKDAEFQLDLLIQSLLFSRVCFHRFLSSNFHDTVSCVYINAFLVLEHV